MTVSGTITGNFVAPGAIVGFGLQIGTHHGAATGELTVELVAGDRRVTGTMPLLDAVDNAILTIPLEAPMLVRAGETIRYTVRHPDASNVAVWLWPSSNAALQLEPFDLGAGRAPRWLLQYGDSSQIPVQVQSERRSPRLSIRRLVAVFLPARFKRSTTLRRIANRIIRVG